jgi:hypothetical protein
LREKNIFVSPSEVKLENWLTPMNPYRRKSAPGYLRETDLTSDCPGAVIQIGIIALCPEMIEWKLHTALHILTRFLQQKPSRGKDLLPLATFSQGGWPGFQSPSFKRWERQ